MRWTGQVLLRVLGVALLATAVVALVGTGWVVDDRGRRIAPQDAAGVGAAVVGVAAAASPLLLRRWVERLAGVPGVFRRGLVAAAGQAGSAVALVLLWPFLAPRRPGTLGAEPWTAPGALAGIAFVVWALVCVAYALLQPVLTLPNPVRSWAVQTSIMIAWLLVLVGGGAWLMVLVTEPWTDTPVIPVGAALVAAIAATAAWRASARATERSLGAHRPGTLEDSGLDT